MEPFNVWKAKMRESSIAIDLILKKGYADDDDPGFVDAMEKVAVVCLFPTTKWSHEETIDGYSAYACDAFHFVWTVHWSEWYLHPKERKDYSKVHVQTTLVCSFEGFFL
jgi:hypothetical protein